MIIGSPHQTLLYFLVIVHAALLAVDAFQQSPSYCRRIHTSPLFARPNKSIPKERPPASASEEESTIPAITERFLELTSNPNIAIVIDVENVRGKTAFELDHADLLDRLMVWASLRKYALGRTLVVIDHGSKASAHLLQKEEQGDVGNSLCVTFAGPVVKADDIIARDVNWLISNSDSTNTNHVVVITADQELSWRCRSAARTFDGGPIENPTKLNKVLRRFDDGNVSSEGGGSKGKNKGGKKGRKKKLRAARKRQYQMAAQQHEEAEEEALDVDSIDTLTSTDSAATDQGSNEEEEEDKPVVPTVEIITPQRFLEDLDYALQEWLGQQEQHTISAQSIDEDGDNTAIAINTIPIPTPVSTLQTLFELRGQILTIESALRKKCSLHKRHTMTGELRKLKEEWKEILSSIETEGSGDENSKQSLASALAWSLSSTISSFDDAGEENDGSDTITDLSPLPSSSSAGSAPSMSWEDLTPQEQEKLLLRWGKRRGRTGTRREKTEDRIVLAERLRRQLELILDSNKQQTADREDSPLVNLYADYINAMPSAQ